MPREDYSAVKVMLGFRILVFRKYVQHLAERVG